ncbi:MAG: hypothetical protein JWN44_6202 [Myxococcales bacterium]|nr:hypothetical protein [Myxococcales bacterium]
MIRGAVVAAAAALLLAGCARAASLEPTETFREAFDAARGHRRMLALVSPS